MYVLSRLVNAIFLWPSSEIRCQTGSHPLRFLLLWYYSFCSGALRDTIFPQVEYLLVAEIFESSISPLCLCYSTPNHHSVIFQLKLAPPWLLRDYLLSLSDDIASLHALIIEIELRSTCALSRTSTIFIIIYKELRIQINFTNCSFFAHNFSE